MGLSASELQTSLAPCPRASVCSALKQCATMGNGLTIETGDVVSGFKLKSAAMVQRPKASRALKPRAASTILKVLKEASTWN